jgi:hypothetical protein
MSNITFNLATPADDSELRRLLRENPIPGTISVSFEREPDYFIGANVGNSFHQTVIARDRNNGEIIAMGSRSIRDVYINGTVQRVGYLSDLRITQRYRVMRRALIRALAFFHQLHQDGQVPFYLSSIIEDNLPARRLFSAGLPGLPCFQEYARLYTLAIYCRRKRRNLPMPDGLRLTRGSSAQINEIATCIQYNGARYQFNPHWNSNSLFSPDQTPDLAPENFFLAQEGERVVGCLALWDQRRFKQTIVRCYSGSLARWRGLMNVGARILGWPVLPSPNEPFHYSYASHLAVDDDNRQIFAGLLRALYNHAVTQGNSYFMIGLSEASPFLPVVTASYRHLVYTSQLYLVAWDDGLEDISRVDSRVPGIEIAIL